MEIQFVPLFKLNKGVKIVFSDHIDYFNPNAIAI